LRDAARPPILIAGIGGASLGTELLKCLVLADRYRPYGCDISPRAFGHFAAGFEATAVVDPGNYVESVIGVCRQFGIEVILPGGQEPLTLLSAAFDELRRVGITLAANAPSVVSLFSNKRLTFELLAQLDISTPLTITAPTPDDLKRMTFPCIVKTATESGGSSFVFLARDPDEVLQFVSHLERNGRTAVVQEYLPHDEGEFTVGVLTLSDGRLVGSIALRRLLESKLSVLSRTSAGVISTGYSQGLIADFPAVRSTAERIASAAGSLGPLNVQGRLRNGEFIPFEVNPRFSASSYLRAMAGFNEVDMYLDHLLNGTQPVPGVIRPGYYLRSLTEVFAPERGAQ